MSRGTLKNMLMECVRTPGYVSQDGSLSYSAPFGVPLPGSLGLGNPLTEALDWPFVCVCVCLFVGVDTTTCSMYLVQDSLGKPAL